MRDKPKSIFIERPEGRLHVLVAGDKGPAVLLLSGAGVDNAMLSWRHLIPELSRDHRVYALDWPKQGKSRPWSGIADHAALLACVDAVYAHFGIGQAALVGLSQGGAVAIAYAQKHPERVSALVAAAPAGMLSFPPVVHQMLYLTARMPRLVSWATRAMLKDRESVTRFVERSLFAGPVEDLDDVVDEVLAELRASGGSASDWQNASIGPWRMNVDLRPKLAAITCPTLFIQGDKDIAVPPDTTKAAAAAVPGAQLVMLGNHGHWPNRQSPERFNAIVRGFLEAALG